MDIEFQVKNQIIKRTDENQPVTLSENYLRLCFAFKTEDWNDTTKYMLVKYGGETTRIPLNDDKVILPRVLLKDTTVTFTVYGEKTVNDETYRITTNTVRFYLIASGYVDEYTDILDVITPITIDNIYEAIGLKADTSYVDTELALKINISDVVDDLTHTYTTNPLSAKQGKVLKDLVDTKANSSDVSNALAGKVNISDIKDNLTSTDSDKPLSAGMGKVLKDTVDLKANTSDMTTALNGKSDVGHTHTKSDITDFAHNHDDRYYTESEMDTKLDGKSNTGHTHDDRYYTESETDALLNSKVDKVNGKGLSTNDYTTSEKNKLSGIETGANKTIIDSTLSNTSNNPVRNSVIYQALSNKVDKITGKGLSTNDFTNTYKDILDTFDGDWDEVINDHLDEIVAGVIEELTEGEFYTKSQVDALIVEAIHDLDNRMAITSNHKVIQSGEVADISVQLVQDGVPLSDKDIYFFERLEPSLTLTCNKSVMQTGDVADFTAKLKDSDGSLVQDTDIFFFIEEDEVVELQNNRSLQNEITEINENMGDVIDDSDL